MNFRTLFIMVLLALLFYGQVAAESSPLLFWDSLKFNQLKETGKTTFSPYNSKDDVIKKATFWLAKPTVSVTEKKIAPESNDRHDYVSLSPHFWPNPKYEGGIPYSSKEGAINPEIKDLTRYDSIRVEIMTTAVTELSLAYALTGEERYAQKAVDFLRAWFINPLTKMNPHLRFAHQKKGTNFGTFTGIIETKTFVNLLDALVWLEQSKALEPSDKKALKDWFTAYEEWLFNKKEGESLNKSRNSYGTWYDVQTAALALYVGKPEDAKTIVRRAEELRIELQIDPDGSQPIEQAKSTSLTESASNLQAFILLCRIGERIGLDLWSFVSDDNRSIEKGIDYLLPYLTKKAKWTFWQNKPYNSKEFAPFLYLANLHYAKSEWEKAVTELSK